MLRFEVYAKSGRASETTKRHKAQGIPMGYRVQLVALSVNNRTGEATPVDTIDCGIFPSKAKAERVGFQKASKFNRDDWYLCRRHADIVQYHVARN